MGVWICGKCFAENPRDRDDCKRCGTKQTRRGRVVPSQSAEVWGCNRCQAENPKDWEFCKTCKKAKPLQVKATWMTPREETWTCRRCRSHNPKSCGFCKECGQNLNQLRKAKSISAEDECRECARCTGKTYPPAYMCPRCCTEELKVEQNNTMHSSIHSGIDPREQRIVLIGKTGAGKSATANTILNERCFLAKSSPKSITTKCQYVRKESFNRKIMMVDTPGLFDTNLMKDIVDQEIKKCITISAPGPHAFLLITSLTNRFTKEEANVFNELSSMFGEHMTKYLIVVFTGRDQIDDPVESHIAEYPEELKQILQASGGGYVTFNNKGSDKEKENDVRDLLHRIDEMLKKNGRSHFTSEMFEEAEGIMQDRITRELEAKEDEMRREIKQEMKKEMEEIMKAEREEFRQIREKDLALMGQIKKELKKEKERKKRKYARASEKAWTNLLQMETERMEKKNALIQEIETADSEEKIELQTKLASVEQEIKDIVRQRKKVESLITGERLTSSFIDRSMKLREEERDKTEKEDEETLRRYRQIGLNLYGSRFLNMFSEK